jgi:dinuclear metal center YbgI/SA1388 family protein
LTKVEDIVVWAGELLDTERFEDYGPNGLQVPLLNTPGEVGTLVTGVSAHLELLQRARDARADLVLVHHGLFWDGAPRALPRPQARRLHALLGGGMALAAYHLPLDAHPEIGNNALIAEGLRCDSREPFGELGTVARFAGDGLEPGELFARVRALTDREPLVFDAGPQRVRTVGIVSGGAAGQLDDAVAAGLDAFLTGEPKEPVMGIAREAGIHFIAAGHYATETFGIRRLGELAAERFGVRHEFIDVPNPI